MYQQCKMIAYRAITPLHCGTDEGSAAIDLPVARERTTSIPLIPGSSLKGVWRDTCERTWRLPDGTPDKHAVHAAFGTTSDIAESGKGEDGVKGGNSKERAYAGCLGFTDATLLFLPIRASRKTFVMITCPLQLDRYAEAYGLAGLGAIPLPHGSVAGPKEKEIWCSVGMPEQEIYLEDVILTIKTIPAGFTIPAPAGLPSRITSRLAVVSDETFQWFARHALEVAAHNVLDEVTKTSKNLWYEEVVPTEAVFFGLVLTSEKSRRPDDKESGIYYLGKLTKPYFFQVGGHETTGRGLMDVLVCGQEAVRKP
jgi:CRISPR-associated protein Cmr4